MVDKSLGRLEPVELRDIWASEATAFTPWLARPDNLNILGNALGLALELEAQERSVGPFRADILCRDVGTGHWVLIENQLERTDHLHLGQLLTYAAGLEAVTIVWIARTFTEEHRAALDWLNRITNETFNFIGVEVELWRIGGSPAAPKFNIVSKPNDWSRAVADAARAIDDIELSETQVFQRAYWSAFQPILDAMKGPISGNRKPQPQSWMGYKIGRSHFLVSAVMLRTSDQVRAELYISGPQAKTMFALLKLQKEAIEHDLGCPLVWEELPEGQDCRIAIYLSNSDPEKTEDWPRQHKWLAERLNELHRVFSNRVRDLKSDARRPGGMQ